MASTTVSTIRQFGSSGIVDALNQEWIRLDRDTRPAVAEWGLKYAALAGCHSVDRVLDLVRDRPDATLPALIAATAAGDQLAGRVVLQSMIGRVVRMAQRDVRAGVDDYVAALWCVITTYPLARRPVRIAANLALDTLKAVHREHRWLARGEVTTWPPGELLDELFRAVQEREGTGWDQAGGAVDAGAVLTAARTLELIDDAASSILFSVYVEGLSGSEAARRHGTSAGSIRVRCSRAVQRLSRSAVILAEAA